MIPTGAAPYSITKVLPIRASVTGTDSPRRYATGSGMTMTARASAASTAVLCRRLSAVHSFSMGG